MRLNTFCFLMHNALGMGPLKQATSLVETIFKNEIRFGQIDRYILFLPNLDNFNDFHTTDKIIVAKVPIPKITVLKFFIRLSYDLFIIPALCYRYNVTRLYCLFNYYPFKLSAFKTLAIRHDYLLNWQELVNLKIKNRIIEKLRFYYFLISVISSDRFVFQNDIARKVFEEKFDYNAEKCIVLPNPVNPLFESVRTPINFNHSSEKIIFYPSAFYSHKHHKLLLDLIDNHKSYFTENNFKIAITIDQKNDGASHLINDIIARKNDNILINYGTISTQSMRDVYETCFCVLYPSLIESFGNSLIESLKIGIPVIAIKKPYAISACGDAALYFEDRDTNAIIELLDRLLLDNSFYTSRVNASLLQSEKYYSFDIWLRKLAEVNVE